MTATATTTTIIIGKKTKKGKLIGKDACDDACTF